MLHDILWMIPRLIAPPGDIGDELRRKGLAVGNLYTRTKYLNRIIDLNQTPDIKIITGIRRSGKSKLMQAYIEYLKNHYENINIIFIDFMDLIHVIAGLLIILTVFLKTEWKHMNPDITSGKKSCQIGT